MPVPCHIKANFEENDSLGFYAISAPVRRQVGLDVNTPEAGADSMWRPVRSFSATPTQVWTRRDGQVLLDSHVACEDIVVVPNLLCGHDDGSVRCYECEFEGWTPQLDTLVSFDNAIAEGMKLSLNTQLPKPLGCCKQKVMLRQEASCGHVLFAFGVDRSPDSLITAREHELPERLRREPST